MKRRGGVSDESTLRRGVSASAAAPPTTCALTVLLHPVAERIGQVARLGRLEEGRAVTLSRLEPLFGPIDTAETEPLADPYLSRRPLMLRKTADALEIAALMEVPDVRVDGQPLIGGVRVPADDVGRGVVIELADRVALLLHHTGPPRRRDADLGLIGESDAIEDVRQAIRRVADLGVPVLIRGESGTGKELVARAIHASSGRAPGPCVSVNMAAIAPSLAVSELFGHVKGAFTGAVRDHDGFFVQADQGTLFLDEIGDTPPEVQPMLLRVLETGEVVAAGSRSARKVDVRVIAATDAELERAVAEGRFRAPLLHRLCGYEIAVPPLRERLDDLGRLFLHFLRRELATVGEAHRLEPRSTNAAWIPATIMTRLARFDWPGNVRQLANVVRQFVVSNRGADVARLDDGLGRVLTTRRDPAGAERREPPSRIGEDDLIRALEQHAWSPVAAAAELGISRTSLYKLIDHSSRIRKAADLSRDEILAVHRQCGGDTDAMAAQLRVSKRGLLLRIHQLRLEP